jgi:hypothetical protein
MWVSSLTTKALDSILVWWVGYEYEVQYWIFVKVCFIVGNTIVAKHKRPKRISVASDIIEDAFEKRLVLSSNKAVPGDWTRN